MRREALQAALDYAITKGLPTATYSYNPNLFEITDKNGGSRAVVEYHPEGDSFKTWLYNGIRISYKGERSLESVKRTIRQISQQG